MPDESLPQLKVLIAVKSCAQDVAIGANQAIRETWGRDIPGIDGFCLQPDLRFFLGKVAKMMWPALCCDESILDCGDGYYALPDKTREILKWSIARNYEFTFLCDTDSWVHPAKLLYCGFERFDLTGLMTGPLGVPRAHQACWSWPSGGAGYWLSSRAARIIVAHPPTGDWAEDKMVGQILGPHLNHGELTGYDCPGFHVPGGISLHCEARANRKDYDPQWMRDMYAKWGTR